MDVVRVLTDTMVLGLTDWQIRNLARYPGCRFCCGSNAWSFYSLPSYLAIEVVANSVILPRLDTLIEPYPDSWVRTFRHLCRISGVIRSAYGAYMEDCLDSPLTNYSDAIEKARQCDVKEAIRRAYRCRCR
jgi:hypothetical protein